LAEGLEHLDHQRGADQVGAQLAADALGAEDALHRLAGEVELAVDLLGLDEADL